MNYLITGLICSGKSTFLDIAKKYSFDTIKSDDIVSNLYSDESIVHEIEKHLNIEPNQDNLEARVKKLFCIDPSEAINVAKKNLDKFDNIKFLKETTEDCSIKANSQDFGYSLGVLHHIPDTNKALKDCAKLLKSKSPFLLYLYYNFENKPLWFRFVWKISDLIRNFICKLPQKQKKRLCNLIAYFIYFPLSRLSSILEKIGINVENIPLSDYRSKPFYMCKNDALDRFGTRLEQRFSKSEIINMLKSSGFKNIKFSNKTPYWVCLAEKI